MRFIVLSLTFEQCVDVAFRVISAEECVGGVRGYEGRFASVSILRIEYDLC